MWIYNPKVNRVIKLPPSMMSQSWMGSDFSNNDLAKSDSIIQDYDHTIESTHTRQDKTVYVINSMPNQRPLWYVVTFIAMGFGIVNTTLMSIFERMREFGVLKALGMKPWWIVRGVLTESAFLLLLGTAAGDLLSIVAVAVLAATGIDLSSLAAGAEFAGMSRIIYPSLTVSDVGMANLVVCLLGLLVSTYPAVKAARFTPVEAMAHT